MAGLMWPSHVRRTPRVPRLYARALVQPMRLPTALPSQVAVTKITPIARPVLLSRFQDREDLIEALMTSCHVRRHRAAAVGPVVAAETCAQRCKRVQAHARTQPPMRRALLLRCLQIPFWLDGNAFRREWQERARQPRHGAHLVCRPAVQLHLCSSPPHLPPLPHPAAAPTPAEFRGERHCDGGLTNFIPLPPGTVGIRVCCFPSKQLSPVYRCARPPQPAGGLMPGSCEQPWRAATLWAPQGRLQSTSLAGGCARHAGRPRAPAA